MNRPTFKEIMRHDIKNTFFNPLEFGEEHTVNGRKMLVIIDDIELTEREKRIKSYMDGVYKKQTLIYVSASEFGKQPIRGELLILGTQNFVVMESANESGVYSIHLEANKN